jgi:hypothetical protein
MTAETKRTGRGATHATGAAKLAMDCGGLGCRIVAGDSAALLTSVALQHGARSSD